MLWIEKYICNYYTFCTYYFKRIWLGFSTNGRKLIRFTQPCSKLREKWWNCIGGCRVLKISIQNESLMNFNIFGQRPQKTHKYSICQSYVVMKWNWLCAVMYVLHIMWLECNDMHGGTSNLCYTYTDLNLWSQWNNIDLWLVTIKIKSLVFKTTTKKNVSPNVSTCPSR